MKRLLKFYSSHYKSGVFVLIALGLVYYFCSFIWQTVYSFLGHFVASHGLLVLLSASFIILVPAILGLLLYIIFLISFVAPFLEWLTPRAPNLAAVLKLLSPVKEERFAEVRVTLGDANYPLALTGYLAKEYTLGEEEWCRVGVPTYPLPTTGFLIDVRKSQLRKTGRSFSEMAVTYFSFGTK